MNYAKIESLLRRLISETNSGCRVWLPVSAEDLNTEKNSALYYLLFQNEYHRVDFESAYKLHFANGWFYLVREWAESGRDGTIFDGLNLYVQTAPGASITRLASDTAQLYGLKIAIEEQQELPKDVSDFVESFLES